MGVTVVQSRGVHAVQVAVTTVGVQQLTDLTSASTIAVIVPNDLVVVLSINLTSRCKRKWSSGWLHVVNFALNLAWDCLARIRKWSPLCPLSFSN